ncbi:dynamin family protein [uncultured Selenomonas sp.]|uniref:dynamin family protein n=1 Tax=uncultured Selenomonas sp. TaxID=159275 RepID=UPI0025D7631B|nr:dynamin family protein [uncultured Selenomonas sp.]
MAQVFVKYNPYKLETQIEIDGCPVKSDSELYKYAGTERRMQEWIGEFPALLRRVLNTRTVDIEFYGLPLDWDDFAAAFHQAQEQGILADVTLHFTQGKTMDEETMARQIAGVFDDLRKDDAPLDTFQSPVLAKAVEDLQQATFPVNVIATMSSGKSTLINALLGKKLMPAKNEACTAVITAIRDNDKEPFSAVAYDEANEVVGTAEALDEETMKRWNSDAAVSSIAVEGNIPFVDAKNMALVLVDTPGPNNSQNQAHKNRTYHAINNDKNNMILYVLNGTQLGTNDDDALLNYVARQMREGSKQMRDRFLFVINRMDAFNPKNEDIGEAVKKAIGYLERHGIEHPQVFPCSALAGLEMRTMFQGKTFDDLKDAFFQTEMEMDPEQLEGFSRVTKLNTSEALHLEQYAALSPTAKQELDEWFAQAKKADDKIGQALIHSGICSIESAIRAYVKKYARTKKVKDVIETFQNVLDEQEVFAEAKMQVAESEKSARACASRLATIRAYLEDGKEAQRFKDKLRAFDPMKNIRAATEKRHQEINRDISAFYRPYQTNPVIRNREQAQDFVKAFTKIGSDKMAELSADIESIVYKELVETSEALVREYQTKLAAFDKQASEGVSGLELHTADLVKSALQAMQDSLRNWQSDQFAKKTVDENSSVKLEEKSYWLKVGEEEEQVPDGTHEEKIGTRKVFAGTHEEKIGTRKVKNEDKSWWQFWKDTWVEEDVYKTVTDFRDEDVYMTVQDYKTVVRDIFEKQTDTIEHFSMDVAEIHTKLGADLHQKMDKGIEKAFQHAEDQVQKMKKRFSKTFDVLDEHIREKYRELEAVAKDQVAREVTLAENRKVLAWLEENKAELDKIIEI